MIEGTSIESPHQSYRLPEKYIQVLEKARRGIRFATAGLLVFLASCGKPSNEKTFPDASLVESVTTIDQSTAQDSRLDWSIDLGWRDWLGPTLEYRNTQVTTTQKEISIVKPYEYSREFNTATESDEGSQEKIDRLVRQELARHNLGETVSYWWGLGGTESVAGSNPDQVSVMQIRVTGFTSPEAEIHGAHSVKSGVDETENWELGIHRADNTTDQFVFALQHAGLDTDSAEILEKSKELEFSPDEIQMLVSAAKDAGIDIDTHTPYEAVFEVTRLDNMDRRDGGNRLSPEVRSTVRGILDSKRGALLELTGEYDEKQTNIVPVPLLLFLLLLRLRRRTYREIFFSEMTSRDEFTPDELKGGVSPDSTTPTFVEVYGALDERLSQKSDFYNMQTEQNGMPIATFIDTERIRTEIIYGEIHEFFRDIDSRRLGLDYEAIIAETANHMITHPGENSNDENNRFLAYLLLRSWQKHDRAVRKKKDDAIHKIHQVLGYDQDPEKVLWARIAAESLVPLIAESVDSGSFDRKRFEKLLTDLSTELEKKRIEQIGEGLPELRGRGLLLERNTGFAPTNLTERTEKEQAIRVRFAAQMMDLIRQNTFDDEVFITRLDDLVKKGKIVSRQSFCTSPEAQELRVSVLGRLNTFLNQKPARLGEFMKTVEVQTDNGLFGSAAQLKEDPHWASLQQKITEIRSFGVGEVVINVRLAKLGL